MFNYLACLSIGGSICKYDYSFIEYGLPQVVSLATGDGVLQSDLQANFSLDASSSSHGSFFVGALLTFNAPSYMTVYINGTVMGSMIMQAGSPFGKETLFVVL